jgi:Large ribosomal RNA subunit accumulation protein YceD
MPEREKVAAPPWHVPVALDDVPEEGRHFDLAADADTRAAVARIAGLRDLPRLEASFDLTRSGRAGLHVAGRVSATAGQTCVVTLEPLANEVTEDIDLLFEPPPALPAEADGAAATPEGNPDDETEPLVDGKVDLGALATEFLILGLDPYPRKPGAVFEQLENGKPEKGPFAALGRLAKRQDQSQD